ncbi:Nickel-type superoxide dismutase maturation protease [Hyella patelloides LEGE 07179]|uniref:Nickel-type superoxide dismutase maturation protease n=1 Tax=Hyella patelloides LEGE 07179 TaxID=945734 RepID=A0A563VYB7_9CYAN|nr:nickel-type superoxide dismutase maturation protease [Hyella patelloides]VEP16419.1 Nickel-type superoxide dismutase maturation protease [Hyella patelloides LEGE 07179]
MLNELPNTSYREFFLWIIRKRKRFQVTGISMQPLLQPGEEILINPDAYKKTLPQINDLVVVTHPDKKGLEIVKRISSIAEDGTFFLLGDNLAHSTDSRSFGTIHREDIIGKVTSIFS